MLVALCLLVPDQRAMPAGVARASAEASLRLAGPTMGTRWTIEIAGAPPPGIDVPRLTTAVSDRLAAIDAAMSTWRPDSTLQRFNASSSTAWTHVDRDTAGVVVEALRTGRRTHGALDPTVLPLVELWGFGSTGPAWRRPRTAAIEDARAHVGLGLLDVRLDPPAIRKRHPDVRVDLSAVAKGFAVDAVTDVLEAHGITRYLVEIGGELRGRGENRQGHPWRVAIERPGGAPGTSVTVVALADTAIATSGDTHQHFDADGVRYSHVIDPRTGAPIAHDLAAVSVIDRSAMRADALATALLVLGPETGLRVARHAGLAAFFVIRGVGGLTTRSTAAFDAHVLPIGQGLP